MKPEKTVTISEERYLELIDTEKWADALEAGHVCDWSGYETSLKDFGYYDEDE